MVTIYGKISPMFGNKYNIKIWKKSAVIAAEAKLRFSSFSK